MLFLVSVALMQMSCCPLLQMSCPEWTALWRRRYCCCLRTPGALYIYNVILCSIIKIIILIIMIILYHMIYRYLYNIISNITAKSYVRLGWYYESDVSSTLPPVLPLQVKTHSWELSWPWLRRNGGNELWLWLSEVQIKARHEDCTPGAAVRQLRRSPCQAATWQTDN